MLEFAMGIITVIAGWVLPQCIKVKGEPIEVPQRILLGSLMVGTLFIVSSAIIGFPIDLRNHQLSALLSSQNQNNIGIVGNNSITINNGAEYDYDKLQSDRPDTSSQLPDDLTPNLSEAVGNVSGTPAEWDGDSKSVIMGASDEVQGIDLFDNYNVYAANYGTRQIQKSDNLTKSVGGVEVNHWLYMKNGMGSSQPKADAYAYYNLGGKYTTLIFEAATRADTVLYVYGDNESILGEVSLRANQVPQKVTIPLHNTTQLHFEAELPKNTLNNDDSTLGIINACLFL